MTTSATSKRPARAVEVWMELGSELARFADSFEATLLARGLGSELTALLGRLGLAGEALVEIRPVESTRPMRIRVHGAVQPYPHQMLVRAWLAEAPSELHDLPVRGMNGSSPGFPARWLGSYARAPEGASNLDLVRATLERLAAQTVLERASCLVGPGQVDAYAEALDRSPAELPTLMGTLLDLGVPLRNREVVQHMIDEGATLKRPFEDTIEAAFTELRAHALEIQIHPATLRELVGVSERDPFSVYDPRIDALKHTLFQDLERTFFSAFGFLLPGLRWAPSTAMKQRMVAIRLGAWRGFPTPVLPQGERLVVAPAEELRERHGMDARPAVNPATGMPCALVDTSLKEECEAQGFITWGPIDFVLVVLMSDLARRAGTLLGMEDVEYQLAQLPAEADELLPASAQSALTLFSLGDLTRVMRALVGERLSLRDLTGLLERLVQYETLPLSPHEGGDLLLLDHRLPVPPASSRRNNGSPGPGPGWPSYYAFLRRQLASHLSISYFHALDERRIYAYALDPKTEELACRSPMGLDDGALESLRDDVRTQLGNSPAAVTVVATTTRARQSVRELLAPEFPELPVLAYAELSPEFEVKPLGTVSAFRDDAHAHI